MLVEKAMFQMDKMYLLRSPVPPNVLQFVKRSTCSLSSRYSAKKNVSLITKARMAVQRLHDLFGR